jgi:PhzF family phenazine biosynthesis protein
MKYYDVFKADTNGGKRLAVIDDSLSESVMPEIAISSQAPITAFIQPVGANLVFAQLALSQSRAMTSIAPTKNIVQVRFFTNQGKEKLESDSGALVVAHHIRQTCTVQMQAGNLEVTLEDGVVWTAQPDTHILPLPSSTRIWLDALNLKESDLETDLTVMCAGTLDKHNVIVPIRETALNLEPDFNFLADLLKTHALNGCIVVSLLSTKANLEYRFFAPHKGLFEDNAGSFSLASICGYLAAHSPSGFYDQVAAQGFQMGKPSELRARFIARDGVALAVRVGGQVESVYEP